MGKQRRHRFRRESVKQKKMKLTKTVRKASEVDKGHIDSIDSLICTCGSPMLMRDMSRVDLSHSQTHMRLRRSPRGWISAFGVSLSWLPPVQEQDPVFTCGTSPETILLRRIEFGLFLVRAAAVHGLCQLLKIDFQAQTAVRLGSNIRNDFINDHKLEESSMAGVFSLVGVGIWVKKWIDWII